MKSVLQPGLGSAYVSIRQHTSAYVSIRQHTSAYAAQVRPVGENRTHEVRAATRTLIARTSAYVSICQHTSAYVSVRQRTSAYVSMCVYSVCKAHVARTVVSGG
jgi:hypothetical protein